MKTRVQDDKRVPAFLELMSQIADAHDRLLEVVEEKIAAMRGANVGRIEEVMRREQQIVQFIQEREGLRRQLTESIARGFGVSAEAARRMTADAIADRFGAAHADAIRAAAARLRSITARIAERNEIARRISEGICRHMKLIFAAITSSDGGLVRYGADGAPVASMKRQVFDAVG